MLAILSILFIVKLPFNIQKLCPFIANVLVNTYHDPAHLFVDGKLLYSYEDTTQGDPLTIPFYALATLPPVHKICDSINHMVCRRCHCSYITSSDEDMVGQNCIYLLVLVMATIQMSPRHIWYPRRLTSKMQSPFPGLWGEQRKRQRQRKTFSGCCHWNQCLCQSVC